MEFSRQVRQVRFMFEFDSLKNESNKIKHGIHFEESKILWNDPNRIVIEPRTVDEIEHEVTETHWG
ncbi:Ribonuclease toxin, BrnT, of type II toxin-antitoxin system [Algoriphagus boritolerans DSM 17298 = JCM 18970]|uniref:Ribonuclease toxin, BrnT, of type II toxin-antitoxin system n=1 Tax=Algoriphagus boritolerans DSM 17298 = JCM 18970 TaxID=1120964 RepID=A0A1H5Y320_9BACT|nr:Ribonuclease toxin, BrnT, of type II toxin-antitoxin system [Algoriphagus boritolerans DSM 17298 = JCM 18970]